MENAIFLPNEGAMPSPDNLPTLLLKPVALLAKLPCVAGVISGLQQEDTSTMLLIRFRGSHEEDYRKALDCFKVDGLKANYLHVNMADRFIKIKLKITKTLLN